ncbi:DUF547 domain-containing protein [Stappia indica]|uniref:DUF547 domain-containing protein n=1 Tax=Stappia indica TaxID=538381 RepID=UPI0009F34326|nr:DUF547 domain-containing protein [Stappia indica]
MAWRRRTVKTQGEAANDAGGTPLSYRPLSRRMVVAGIGAAALVRAPRAEAAEPPHEAFTELLQRYVAAGGDGLNRVRYARFREEGRTALDRYIESLAGVAASRLPRDEAFAYWVNLYNAVTLQVVLAHYPVASIRDIDLGGGFFSRGPWRKDLVRVEGRDLSLDDIEHEILRKRWREPRVHYAVNCASIGCPNLARRAYRARDLERMLDEGARAFINHPRGVEAKAEGLRVSRIYSWFDEDFGSERDLRRHWRSHADGTLAARLDANPPVIGYDYDWRLNDAR